MIYGPCMCGAYDCRSCHPESFTEVSCDCCGEKTVAIGTDDWELAEIDGVEFWFCPDCANQTEEITCAGCGEKIIRFDAEDWEELEGDAYCPECVEKIKNAAEEK